MITPETLKVVGFPAVRTVKFGPIDQGAPIVDLYRIGICRYATVARPQDPVLQTIRQGYYPSRFFIFRQEGVALLFVVQGLLSGRPELVSVGFRSERY